MSTTTAKWISTSSAADFLGLSKQTVVSYAKEGRIPASFYGRRWRFRPEDLDSFAVSQRRGR